jgi:hypothetical protein
VKLKYTVHSVGPYEKIEDVTRADGTVLEAKLQGFVVDLVPVGHDGSTVHLVYYDGQLFAAGDEVEATFEKAGGA